MHTCYAYHRHGETLDMEDMGYVSRYPRSLKLANFLDFGILGKIRNFTKSMDFMISAHLGTILDPILGMIWTSFGTVCTWWWGTMYSCIIWQPLYDPLRGSDVCMWASGHPPGGVQNPDQTARCGVILARSSGTHTGYLYLLPNITLARV